MKHIYKIILVFSVIVFFNSCDNSEGENEGKFDANPETGWVQFLTEASELIELDLYDTSMPLIIPVMVNVPINDTDLSTSYSFVSISGQDPNSFFSNSGILITPSGKSSFFGNDFSEIKLDMAEVASITEPMEFDIVLNSTNRPSITIGIAGSDRPTSYRVSICPLTSESTNSASGNFLGDYSLTVTTGPSPFGPLPLEDQVITITEGLNGEYSRQFDTFYLGLPFAGITITFTFENGNIIVDNGFSTGVGCSSSVHLGGDASNIVSIPCGDETLQLNMVEFQSGTGGCGVSDIPFTAILTKI